MPTTNDTAANREVMTRLYNAGIASDLDSFLDCLDASFELHEPPFLHYGGAYRGLDEFKKVFAEVAAMLDVTALVVESITVEDDRAFVRAAVPTHDGEPVSLCEE